LENNSFFLKFSKSKLALIIIVAVLLSSSYASNYVNNYIFLEFGPDYIVKAIMLDEKPKEFIPFSRLEAYGIQNVFNSSTGVVISFKVFWEINELISSYDTSNVEYGINYYRLRFDFVGDTDVVQSNIPISLIVLSYAISSIWLIAVILLLIIVIINLLRILRRAGVL